MASISILSGCGGGQLSEADTREVWSRMSRMLMGGGGQALTVDIDVAVDCADGGTVTTDGALDASAGEATFDYDVTFASCAADGDTIDGALSYTSSVDSTPTGAALVFGYEGSFSVSGAHNGACDVDMQGLVDVVVASGLNSVVATYEGTICGHDASATLDASVD